MGVEDAALAAVLAAIARAGVLLADQLLPDVGHLDRRIAGLRDQLGAHRVGFGFHRAAVLEQRQDRSKLGKLDIIAEIDAGAGATDSGEHRPDREDVRLAFLVAPRTDHVAAQEMPAFVRDHASELRLVAHPQEQAGEDDRKAGREHHRVELGDPRQIDTEVLGRGAADGADQVLAGNR